MAKKKKSSKEQRRRAKIKRALKVYHNDVRAVMKATGLGWRDSQKLIPANVRRPHGKGRAAREDIVAAAVERVSVEREPISPENLREEEIRLEVVYQDVIDYLIEAARKGEIVEFRCSFFMHGPEKLSEETRAWELFREFGARGDAHRENFKGELKDKQPHTRYWRIRKSLFITINPKGWSLSDY